MRRVTLVVLLTLLSSVSSAAGPDPEFAAAMKESQENAKTPEGKRYDEAFGATFAQKHQKTVVRCAKGLDSSELAGFDILARVTATGQLESVLVHPKTKLAECVRTWMQNHGYPGPPRPHYWVNVRMNLTE